MNTILLILIGLTAAATAFVLVKGIITMARGKDITGVQSNKLMSTRVLLQAVTILLVVLLLLLSRMGN